MANGSMKKAPAVASSAMPKVTAPASQIQRQISGSSTEGTVVVGRAAWDEYRVLKRRGHR